MENKEWLKLIEDKEELIIETGIKAYKEAMNNENLRFIVEMNNDGEVYYWYDIASGNTYHMSIYNGTSIELFQFCFQGNDLEISEEEIVEKLNEKGYGDKIEKLREEAEEEYTDIEGIISSKYSNGNLYEILEECREESIEFNISNYAREEAEDKLEDIKRILG